MPLTVCFQGLHLSRDQVLTISSAAYFKETTWLRNLGPFHFLRELYPPQTLNISPFFQLFTLAESLGGYESLAELPSVMTHASVPAEERAKIGLTDNLIRLSVGVEDTQDLLDDLDRALTAAVGPKQ